MLSDKAPVQFGVQLLQLLMEARKLGASNRKVLRRRRLETLPRQVRKVRPVLLARLLVRWMSTHLIDRPPPSMVKCRTFAPLLLAPKAHLQRTRVLHLEVRQLLLQVPMILLKESFRRTFCPSRVVGDDDANTTIPPLPMMMLTLANPRRMVLLPSLEASSLCFSLLPVLL